VRTSTPPGLTSLLLAVAVVGWAAYGCSSDAETKGPATTTTPQGGGGAGGGTGGAGGAAGGTGYGFIHVHVGAGDSSLFGFFGADTTSAGGGDCSDQTFGACTLSDCSAFGGGGGAPPNLSAGTLSVTSGALSITATPAADGSYSQTGPALEPWSDGGGEDVGFHATGDVVPAFDMHLGSPGIVHVTSPVFPADPFSAMMLSTSSDLQVVWTGGATSATVYVYLDDNTGNGLVFEICKFAAEEGQGTVSASALAWLAGKNGSLSVNATTSASSNNQGWALSARAHSSGLGSDGQDTSNHNLTFQ
jgi:hypothetical protein